MLEFFQHNRIIKFLLGGGVAAAFNLAAIAFLIEVVGFDTPWLRNIANAIAIELSLVLSFFIYRTWVWLSGVWSAREILLRQLPLYHFSAGAAILLRVFAIFPFLDWLGLSYGANTLIGVLVSASINYTISDRLVFRNRQSRSTELYPPEGLSPSFPDRSISPPTTPRYYCNEFLLSLVIPAHNEEGCLEPTVNAICECLDAHRINYEIVVVNDGSRDRTEAILQNLSHHNPHLNYINNYYPNGFGFAVRCGLENFQGDAVAIVMADGSDRPIDIVRYYDKLREGYDCVFGSRFIRGGKVIDYPAHKLVINRLANWFVKVLFNISCNDTTNAFKAYRRETIEGISPLLSHHFNLTVEMPLKAIVRGYSCVIIPITWSNRKAGVSKLKIREMGSRYLFIVLYLFLEKWLSRGDYVRKDSFQMTVERANKILTR